MKIRQTQQQVLPVRKPAVKEGAYDIYPSHRIGAGTIHEGYASLAREVAGEKVLIVDGYVGVVFSMFRLSLDAALREIGLVAVWHDVSQALKTPTEVDALIAPYLGGDDPVFGYRAALDLRDFFDTQHLASLIPDRNAALNIFYGVGASLCGVQGKLIYLDIPKNEIQFRARAGAVINLGAVEAEAPKRMYKRFYFIDWVVLNKHKKTLLKRIDWFVDTQRPDTVTWCQGAALREGLQQMGRSASRVRPWFEPGAWGGQWIKNHIHALPQDVPNYAWSFELIVPENGLLLESDSLLLETSFDTLMFEAGEQVVGTACRAAYGDEFPIRMDYLDTFDGGNLSVQCHPRKEYIQKNFGEVLTQEETYYILDTRKDAVVYLGFKEGVVPEQFHEALQQSFEQGLQLDTERYINAQPSHKHALYLIPPGTLHSAGRDNLVLEISTTPYIFTFKMYDWQRLDLDGRPRPLNIQRAMDNLYFDRKGDRIGREFVSRPTVTARGEGWSEEHLPTHAAHSYDVKRYTVATEVVLQTDGKCHVLNLVEGRRADVVTASGDCFHLSYAETLVVSAAAGSYRIVCRDSQPVMVVNAYMK